VTSRVRRFFRGGSGPSSLASLEEELGRTIAVYRDAVGVEGNAESFERFGDLARRGRRVGEDRFARRAQVMAAEAAFFACQADSDAGPWARRALAELVDSSAGLAGMSPRQRPSRKSPP
jgi:hypothetical protein